MSEPRFQLIFAGQLLAGTQREQAFQALQERFKLSNAQLERLFSGGPIRVKRDLSRDQAERYRRAFHAAGALVELHPMNAEPGSTSDTAVAATDNKLRQVDALDAAPSAPSAPAAGQPDDRDPDALRLLPPGAPIGEQRQPPERPPPETDHLQLAPSEATSLEDCAPPTPSPPPLDLSNLSLAPLDEGAAEGAAEAKPSSAERDT